MNFVSFTVSFQLSTARTLSPGLILRDYGKRSPAPAEDITRLYTYSYLTEEPSMGYLRKPIDPYDRPPKSPHFHRPQSKDIEIFLPPSKRLTFSGYFSLIQAVEAISEAVYLTV